MMRESEVDVVQRFLRSSDSRVEFDDFTYEQSVLQVRVLIEGRPIVMSYMDAEARSLCTRLANALSDLLDRNVFFDLKSGWLTVFLTPT